MSAIGLVDKSDPAANPDSFRIKGLIPAFVVLGVLVVSCVICTFWRKRNAIRRHLHMHRAAKDAHTPRKVPSVYKLVLTPSRVKTDEEVKGETEPKHEAQNAMAAASAPVIDVRKPERKLSSREDRLAQLEEGIFGKDGGSSASQADRPVISSISKPISQEEAAKPVLEQVVAVSPKVATNVLPNVPRIAIRKATTPFPEAMPLPDSPVRETSPPRSVASGMRLPPLPPSDADSAPS